MQGGSGRGVVRHLAVSLRRCRCLTRLVHGSREAMFELSGWFDSDMNAFGPRDILLVAGIFGW